MKGIAGALGMDPGELAGTAAGIGQAASSGGFASAEAIKAGISPAPYPVAHQDRAADLLLLLTRFRTAPTEKDAQQSARFLGGENLLSVRDMSPSVYQNVLKQAKLDPKTFDTSAIQTAANYQAAQGNLTAALDRLKESLDKGIVPLLTKLTGGATSKVDAAVGDITKYGVRGAAFAAKFPAPVNRFAAAVNPRPDLPGPGKHRDLGQSTWDRFLHGPRYVPDTPGRPNAGPPPLVAPRDAQGNVAPLVLTPGLSPEQQKMSVKAYVEAKERESNKAEAAHTQAMNRHTAALEKNAVYGKTPGTYGNANRGEAIHEGQTGLSLHKQLKREGFQLGAF